jgi:hypothetical protein
MTSAFPELGITDLSIADNCLSAAMDPVWLNSCRRGWSILTKNPEFGSRGVFPADTVR